MNLFSMRGLKRAGAGVQILLMTGVVGAGCKEDLDEARSALAEMTRDRDALGVRVAQLEHELATTRAELAKQKAVVPAAGATHAAMTRPAPMLATPATPLPAVAGKTGAANSSGRLEGKGHGRSKS